MKNELTCFDFLIKKTKQTTTTTTTTKRTQMFDVCFQERKIERSESLPTYCAVFRKFTKVFLLLYSVWRYKEEDFDQIVDEYFKSICRKTAQNLIISETY